MELTVLNTYVLSDADSVQQRVLLPPAFAARFPAKYVAEFNFTGVSAITLRMVDPDTPARAKRYSVVRHHGSAIVSMPRPWLRDISARDGDTVELCANADTPDELYLRFKRKVKR